MVCEDYRSSLKKYTSRPSPPFPANNVECHYRTFVGNDGNSYSSQPNNSGIFKWIRVVKANSRIKKSVKRSVKRSPKSKPIYIKATYCPEYPLPKALTNAKIKAMTKAQVYKTLVKANEGWEKMSGRNQDIEDLKNYTEAKLKKSLMQMNGKKLRDMWNDQYCE
jgi:hypothetical protein